MRSIHFLHLLSFLLIALLPVACGDKDDDSPVVPPYRQTVLVYMAADNSLTSWAREDLAEMLEGVQAVQQEHTHLLVYIDFGGEARLVEVVTKKDGTSSEKLLKTYPGADRNSVGLTEMQEVLADAFGSADYQADKYGFVFWSHGDGWIPSSNPQTRWIGQDWDASGSTQYMNIADLRTALQGAPHLDFILFDACFMQAVEVAYELRECADYFIASPTEIPGPGAPYQVVVPCMFADNAATGIAAAYYEYYAALYDKEIEVGDWNAEDSNGNWRAGVSIAVLKSSALQDLAVATRQALVRREADVKALAANLFNYDKRSSNNHRYYDMQQLVQAVADEAAYLSWKQAFDAARIYWNTTEKNFSSYGNTFSMEGTNGVSHYLPSSLKAAALSAYRQTSWYQAAGIEALF